MNLFDLSGCTVVVVGGNSTLGRAMVHGLSGHGAKVAIIGRDFESARAVVDEISSGHDARAHAFQADVTSRADLERVRDEVIEWSGGFDVLFNCPGRNSATPFLELEMDEWDSIMDVNLKGVVQTCQVFAKAMIDRDEGGSIVNISSVSADVPLSRVFTYAASKAGLENATKYLARELAPHRIRVNAIVPGFFPAEQNRKILDPARVEDIMRHTPMSRFGNPEELCGAAVWLASETASSFVTGAMIRVDGGFGAMSI